MLVLSRRKSQVIRFPTLGISIKVLKVEGRTVSIGVEAPKDIRILRDELIDEQELMQADLRRRSELHELRNHLNAVELALSLVRSQISLGKVADLDVTLEAALASLRDAETHSEKLRDPADSPSAPTNLSKQMRTALIVEDNAQERELFAEYLRTNGYNIIAASSGNEALEKLRETETCPNVALLDLQMPGIDGNETARLIRDDAKFNDMKIFLVTGHTGELQSRSPNSVDGTFCKPIAPARFVRELNRMLGVTCGAA